MGEAVRGRAYYPSSERNGHEVSQCNTHPQSRFVVAASPGFQRSQVQVGGARSAFKTLLKGEDGQNFVATVPMSQASMEAERQARSSAGIDYQVVLDQIVPTEADSFVGTDVRVSHDHRGMEVQHADVTSALKSVAESLQRQGGDSVVVGQPSAGGSRGQENVATVPVIFVPAASAAQVVQGLQLGGLGGQVALIPTNDSNAIELAGGEAASPAQQLQAALARSFAPSATSLQSLGSTTPVVMHSAPNDVLPSLPFHQKTPADVSVARSEALAKPMAHTPYVTVAVQSGNPMRQNPTADALMAAALQGGQLSPSCLSELKKLVASGGQAGQFSGLRQVLVAPSGLRSTPAVQTVASQALDANSLPGVPQIVQPAANLPQQRAVVLDKNANQYMMTLPVFPGEGGSVHLKHAK
eukprot:evm.model.scf_362EXC.16 EVM.evm.TU.scf_362EXC.16   scf_362EXC:91692-92927(+)